MKTLREYIDQLDEISRRDFLKGAGAAAVGAAAGGAKGQVGAGENESLAAARRAIANWQRLSRDNQSVTNSLYENLHRRIFQFYQMSRGVNFANATDAALRETLEVIVPEFERFEQILEKEKGSSSLLKAYGLNALGLGSASQQEQLKNIGSMQLVNLVPTANRFLQIYTDSLNRSLQNTQQSTQQSVSNTFRPEADKNLTQIIVNAIGLYVVSKDPAFKVSGSEIKSEIDRFIKKFNARDYVNFAYQDMARQFNDNKSSDPKKYQQHGDWYKSHANLVLNNLRKANGPDEEFKEAEDLEEASPDAVARIEELVKYK